MKGKEIKTLEELPQHQSVADYRHQVLACGALQIEASSPSPSICQRILPMKSCRGRDTLTHLTLPELGHGVHMISSVDRVIHGDL